MASNTLAQVFIITFLFVTLLPIRIESQPSIDLHSTPSEGEEGKSRDESETKLGFNENGGWCNICSKNMNEIKFAINGGSVDHDEDEAKLLYSSVTNKKPCHIASNTYCPLSFFGRFRLLTLYLIFNVVDIMINGRL
ncbi:hypothetical protein CsatA_020263 [Cannabis sativa]